jgi:glyoxylase-like metal-dependent hydrolase (beta-lactamase superfamily II)
METIHFHSTRGCLSYITYDTVTRQGVLIDPSEEIGVEEYLRVVTEKRIMLQYVIETHTHADHISCANLLREKTGAKIARSVYAPSKSADVHLNDGDVLPLGDQSVAVLYTPGHTNESISLYNGKEVFTGDTLLIGGTGRTDFQVGNSEELYESIHEKIELLPHTTLVRPGHNYQGKNVSILGDELHTSERLLLCKDAFIAYMDAYHPPKPELFEVSLKENAL